MSVFDKDFGVLIANEIKEFNNTIICGDFNASSSQEALEASIDASSRKNLKSTPYPNTSVHTKKLYP